MSTMLRLLSVFCLATVTLLFAQVSGPTGIVTGQVINENTGDVLGSAFVRAEGANVSTTADADGNFRLVLPEGPQTVVVSYSGLDDQKVGIYVTPGQETKRDVALTSTLYRMDKFVVKTIREGQAAAIHEERSGANVKNVAAIDAFG